MSKENLHFDDQSKEVDQFPFSSLCFLKEIENSFSMFLSSHRNTRESWEEFRKKLWEHMPAAHVPTAFLVLSNFHSCFYDWTETQHMFSIS